MEKGKEHFLHISNLAFAGNGILFFLLTAKSCFADDFASILFSGKFSKIEISLFWCSLAEATRDFFGLFERTPDLAIITPNFLERVKYHG